MNQFEPIISKVLIFLEETVKELDRNPRLSVCYFSQNVNRSAFRQLVFAMDFDFSSPLHPPTGVYELNSWK